MTPSTLIRSLLPILLATLPVCAQQTETTLNDKGEWVVTDAPEPGSDAATLAEARVKVAEGHPGRAVAILNKWIKKNKNTTNPHLPEAYLLRGRAKMADGNEFRAMFDFERLIREFPASEQFEDANYEEYKIAIAYLDGLNRKTLGLRISPSESVGEETLVRVAERLPGSTLREQAFLSLSDYYYFRAVDMKSAALIYGYLVEQFPNTRYRKEAMAREIYANVARFKGPRYDASSLIEADILIDRFEANFPADARRTGIGDALSARINDSLALQVLENATWYANRGDKPSARFVLQRLMRKHPNTVAAAKGRELAKRIGIDLDALTTDPTASNQGVVIPAPAEPEPPAEIKQTPPGG
jgi:outer membrane protein assembly factor BamD (BamD/ComL family)